MSAPTVYDVPDSGIRWRLPHQRARWFAMTRSDGPSNSNLSDRQGKPIRALLLSVYHKRRIFAIPLGTLCFPNRCWVCSGKGQVKCPRFGRRSYTRGAACPPKKPPLHFLPVLFFVLLGFFGFPGHPLGFRRDRCFFGPSTLCPGWQIPIHEITLWYPSVLAKARKKRRHGPSLPDTL